MIQTVQIRQEEVMEAMFLLNMQSKDPIYEQIQTQILEFINAGVLKPGSKLPSVRQLAQDNGINPNTVSKAYTELEKNGYVYNLPKKGSYVAEFDTSLTRKKEVHTLLKSLKEIGVSKEQMLMAVEELYKEDDDA